MAAMPLIGRGKHSLQVKLGSLLIVLLLMGGVFRREAGLFGSLRLSSTEMNLCAQR
jgi:hypothetical protein